MANAVKYHLIVARMDWELIADFNQVKKWNESMLFIFDS